MSSCFAFEAQKTFYPGLNENIMDSIFKQYERVVIESIVTSFGLDFILKDQHGGDVDTINNVRKVGTDDLMKYKNDDNRVDYESRGIYDSKSYHSDKAYINKNREISKLKDVGSLKDAYTGVLFARNEKSDLDHVISSKEIHEDAGRVLSGLSGIDLANSEINLQATNPRTNRTKKADEMDTFIEKYGQEYTEAQKMRMRQVDKTARGTYNHALNNAYYSSAKFAKDLSYASANTGLRMGLRQALGFIFAEIWFAVKEEFDKVNDDFELEQFFTSIGNGIKRGLENSKEKYKELYDRFIDGAIMGILSSLTTTLINIFFTTAKNTVKIIRQSYVSLVQAAKILFINPDNLPFGDRMRAVLKILSLGASIVVGVLVSEAIEATPVGSVPIIGDIIKTFCGTFVTGIMSCTLLYSFDRSEIINCLVKTLNTMDSINNEMNYYKRQAGYFVKFAAELQNIDIEKFREETRGFTFIADSIENYHSETELNEKLKEMMDRVGLAIPWNGEFDKFMSNKESRLKFT